MSRDIPDLTPREAARRWLDKQRVRLSESSVSTYWHRLKLWVQWCESEGIEHVGDLTAWDIESYETHRRAAGVEPLSLQNELKTLRQHLRYLDRVGLIEGELHETVEPPTVPKSAQVDETRLQPDHARQLLEYWRGHSPGSRFGTLLSLLWYTGARMGAIRALDLQDVDLDRGVLRFRHRPDRGTPLKNGENGERLVGIPQETVDEVRAWLRNRPDIHDGHGRRPLISTERGRASTTTIREWCYYATIRCHGAPCPEEKDPESCEWARNRRAGGCPFSRSPHQVRTGSITWQISQGIPKEAVSERVNASLSVIEAHYDLPSEEESFAERREPYLDRLDFDQDHDEA